jgi:hypothetical protein
MMGKNMRGPFRLALVITIVAASAVHADGVFGRVKIVEPAGQAWTVKVGGYIHNDPWRLPDIPVEVPPAQSRGGHR